MIGEIAIAAAVIWAGWSISKQIRLLDARLNAMELRLTYVEGNTMLSAQHLESIAAEASHIAANYDATGTVIPAV